MTAPKAAKNKPQLIALPAIHSNEGIEARVLLAETFGPSQPGYTLEKATTAMQWMHLILHNRMDNPKPFGAKAHTMLAVVRAGNQFDGFTHYPDLSHRVHHNIQDKLHLANAKHDQRAAAFSAYIKAALEIAGGGNIIDPSPGNLTGWKQSGANSPGDNFVFFRTFDGNDYYYMPKASE